MSLEEAGQVVGTFGYRRTRSDYQEIGISSAHTVKIHRIASNGRVKVNLPVLFACNNFPYLHIDTHWITSWRPFHSPRWRFCWMVRLLPDGSPRLAMTINKDLLKGEFLL